MFSTILVPIDFSDYTDEIMHAAVQLAKKFGSTLHLLHVIPNMDYFTPYESFLPAESLINAQRDIEREVDKDMDAIVGKVGEVPVVRAVRAGVAFAEIVDYVRKQGIDLVVMGTHGRGGIEHILLGSVAEKVIRRAPCPVLTIRPASRKV